MKKFFVMYNSRIKFLKVFNNQGGARTLNWEFAYWWNTIERWYDEGLPRLSPINLKNLNYSQCVCGEALIYPGSILSKDVHIFFGFDEEMKSVPLDTQIIPRFRKKILRDEGNNIVLRNNDGKILKTRKDGTSMPLFLKYPVENKEDFKKLKKRYDTDFKKRLPKNWDKLKKDYKKRSYPLQLGMAPDGFFAVLRELMGFEKACMVFYDDPKFVIEIFDFYTTYWIELYLKVLEDTDIDYFHIFEDMAYRNGSFISPDIFKKFISPYLKKLIFSLRKKGIKNFGVDSDGNINELIPLWLETGINSIYPFEVGAGMDIETTRKQYPNLVIMGGINKNELSKDKYAINKELKKISRMLKKGKYIPFTDHMVNPDTSFENYKYYRENLKKIIDSV
ncbi:MAG: hypothetical protein FJW63_03480 [Actinobacteria bacterium]|nr:hypothetical protein [Actinomycetota bacterium]